MPSLMLVPVAVSEELKQTHRKTDRIALDMLDQWFSNCASRRLGASFPFFKGVAGYFGFVPLSLGFIASTKLFSYFLLTFSQ